MGIIGLRHYFKPMVGVMLELASLTPSKWRALSVIWIYSGAHRFCTRTIHGLHPCRTLEYFGTLPGGALLDF